MNYNTSHGVFGDVVEALCDHGYSYGNGTTVEYIQCGEHAIWDKAPRPCTGKDPGISLTHQGRVIHVCVSKLTHHLFRQWLAVRAAPSYFRNQCYSIVNMLRPRQNGRDFADDFSNAFSWMKMFEYRLKFHWSLLLRVQLTISQYWFR